ncbi:MAG: hypothetical protein GY861_00155 [bacterium]|nr:hypothetical protein [bacterium]
MKKIYLKSSKYPNLYALVDSEDYEILSRWVWYPVLKKTFYAASKAKKEDLKYWGRTIYMHRAIMGHPKGKEVDHINNDSLYYGLNNQKSNLRIVNRSQNNMNQRKVTKPTSSRYKGASWFKRDSKWRSYIKIDGKQIHLGYFDKEEDAAKAYDKMAKRIFGEFAQFNFSE